MPPRTRQRREYHIVVLGAGGVGKSCLTAQFVHNEWIESYDPTIEDTYRKQLNVDGRQCILEILDTAGTEQFTAMRELYMKSGQGFLLVFSITSMSSLRELSNLREDILRIKAASNVPIVIVGNKSDLEEDRTVSRGRACALLKSWAEDPTNDQQTAIPYYETSARRRANVDEVFVDLCRQIIRNDIEATALARARAREERSASYPSRAATGSRASPALNSERDVERSEERDSMDEPSKRRNRYHRVRRRSRRARDHMSCVIL